ncbi:hypothetical protein [Paraflavitalea pollutisoli]|uniref:hypothetical protein n=1 Tax=Paraflavitalea pollutisoli TaxID=3034143 RepID=UPI0023EC8266|nr:hypothetical protein [Paraflavitalea sp. H1-2-19X]
MNSLTMPWKLFRLLSVVQLIVVLYLLVLNTARLFGAARTWTDLIGVISYLAVFLFVCQGLAILSENYPNTPLTQPQKRRFNLLFLVNFLLIAFLFAKTVDIWRTLPLVSIGLLIKNNLFINFIFILLQTVFVFLCHLVFLYGMYRLRQQIHTNTVNDWVQQFDQP